MEYFKVMLLAAGAFMASCAHKPELTHKEKRRAYIFGLGRSTDTWPSHVSLAVDPDAKRPEVLEKKVPLKIDGRKLIEAHKEWIIKKGDAKWKNMQ